MRFGFWQDKFWQATAWLKRFWPGLYGEEPEQRVIDYIASRFVDADDVALSFCAVSDIDDWQLKPTIEMKTAIFSLSNITHKLADAYFIQLNVVQEKEVNYQWEVER